MILWVASVLWISLVRSECFREQSDGDFYPYDEKDRIEKCSPANEPKAELWRCDDGKSYVEKEGNCVAVCKKATADKGDLYVENCASGCFENRRDFTSKVDGTPLPVLYETPWPSKSITVNHTFSSKNNSLDAFKTISEKRLRSGKSLYGTAIEDRFLKGDEKKLYMSAFSHVNYDKMSDLAEKWIQKFLRHYKETRFTNSTIMGLFAKLSVRHYLELFLGVSSETAVPENVIAFFEASLSLSKDGFSASVENGLNFDCVWDYLLKSISNRSHSYSNDDVHCGLSCVWVHYGMTKEDAARNVVESVYPFSNVLALFSRLIEQSRNPGPNTGGLPYHRVYNNPTFSSDVRTHLLREIFRIESPAEAWISFSSYDNKSAFERVNLTFYNVSKIPTGETAFEKLLNLEMHSKYALDNRPPLKRWREETFGTLIFYRSLVDEETLWLADFTAPSPPPVFDRPIYPPFGFGSRRCPMEHYSENLLNVMLKALTHVFQSAPSLKSVERPFALTDHEPLPDYE